MLHQEKKSRSKLSYTANQFYLEAAAKYLRANRTSDMMAMLSHLGTEDQLVFLKTHRQFSEAADLLKKSGRGEEAAKLMKQHGFVLEAAKLTNQLDFRASCLLAAGRRSMAGSYKLEDLTAVLNEALELCEQTHQWAGRAEATYLLGLLEKDFRLLEKAFRLFLDVNHNAGAVEALFQAAHCEGTSEALLRLASHGIEALLNLVKAFEKADTNAQREMVKSCFEYFGIVPVDKKSCQVTPNEAGCILEAFSEMLRLREKKTSDRLLVDAEEVKMVLNKHLLKRLMAIARRLVELRLPIVCTKFIAGLKCKDSACEDFHKVLAYHEVKSVFHCKIYLAAINGLLLEAKRMFPKDLFHEASAIDDLLTADKYALCKSLVNAIFPKHFHLRMISENPAACRSVLTLHNDSRTYLAFRMVLRDYIRSEFKNETAQNRRESTDLLLKTMQVLALISSYPEEFERLLTKEEDEYNREERVRGRRKGVEGKYGMLMPDKSGSAENIHLCFIRLLQNSFDQLYVHRNPEQCKWLFFRFMNVLVKKCMDPLVPSIGNTVTLLEFQFLVSCAVLMRLSKTMTLCLPKSYIALFHYWDFLFAKGVRHKDIFSVIQDYKPDNTKRAIQEFRYHLNYLADVLCGFESFNVLLDAFEDLDYIASGEAERTVVLCLVMLVNADQLLSWKYKGLLLGHFPSLKETLIKTKAEYPSRVPERLLKIVDLVSRATDMKDVVAGLKDLLYCRDEEFLADCSWRWDHRGARGTRFENNKEIRGIYFKIADLNRFSYLAQAEYFDEPDAEQEHDTYAEEREDPLANIASARQQKQQQKAFARWKLQCLFRFVLCCVRWKRRTTSKPEPLEVASTGVFKKADVDTTQCDLCGVKFLPSSSRFIPQTEQSEKEPSEVSTPTEADWEGGAERNENFDPGETYESHVRLDEHRSKCLAYQKYFEYFRNQVEPLINDGMHVLERIADATRIRGRFTAKEETKLVQIKIEEDIKSISDTVEDLYKRKAWADGKILRLFLCHKNIRAAMLEQAAAHRVQHSVSHSGSPFATGYS